MMVIMGYIAKHVAAANVAASTMPVFRGFRQYIKSYTKKIEVAYNSMTSFHFEEVETLL